MKTVNIMSVMIVMMLGGFSAEAAKISLASADKNSDGKISLAEYEAVRIPASKKYWMGIKKMDAAAFKAKGPELKAQYVAAFKHLDKNGDGFLTGKEFNMSFRMSSLKKK